MVEIVKAGGWLMAPIILCAIIALGIILERFWTLQQKRVLPADLTSKVWGWVKEDKLDQKQIQTLHQGSPLGQILAAGLINRDRERNIMKDSIEDTGRHVVHELERYLDTLGTVAAITPLLGLLGTVIGMVKVFAAITTHGVGNPTVLAGG
ncbi:MAG: MotA/TolQ/ExbB proton channel family protein, partial [Woeseia sp.]